MRKGTETRLKMCFLDRLNNEYLLHLKTIHNGASDGGLETVLRRLVDFPNPSLLFCGNSFTNDVRPASPNTAYKLGASQKVERESTEQNSR